MAKAGVDFRRIESSKCAISTPKTVNLEIVGESPESPSELDFSNFFLKEHIAQNGEINSNYASGRNNATDKDLRLSFISHDNDQASQIKRANDTEIDVGLLELLNSTKLTTASESCGGKFKSKQDSSSGVGQKMKFKSNFQVSDDLLSSFAIPDNTVVKNNSTKFSLFDCNEDDIVSNSSSNNDKFLPENSVVNSSFKVENGLSDLLSSINIENSKASSFHSFDNKGDCQKISNNSKSDVEFSLSDMLSTAELNDCKLSSWNSNKMTASNDFQDSDSPSLSELLSSLHHSKVSENTKDEKILKENTDTSLSDLISSIQVPDSKVSIDTKHANVVNEKEETSLSDFLSSINIDESNTSRFDGSTSSTKCDVKSSSNLINCIGSDVLDFDFDQVLDFRKDSSSESCASSFSDTGNNSSDESVSKKISSMKRGDDSDSGFNSLDPDDKDFSFISSFNLGKEKNNCKNLKLESKLKVEGDDDQMSISELINSFNPRCTNPIPINKSRDTKLENDKDILRDENDECLTMFDLMKTISPEFKNLDSTNINVKPTKNSDKLANENSNCTSKTNIIKSINFNLKEYSPQNLKCDVANYNGVTGNDNVDMNILKVEDSALENMNDFFNDDEQITCVDLRACIKTEKSSSVPTSSPNELKEPQNQVSGNLSPIKFPIYDELCISPAMIHPKSPPLWTNTVQSMSQRIKPTLFSKALAAKPKKDSSLLQTVSSIKSKLLKSIYHPTLLNCDIPQPVNEAVIYKNHCILHFAGRRTFGLDASFES
ncbi:uncharacterized protein CDAR_253851 [Caerostris darwini]|uniref:Uncharacterized protein n=1 Tax=Caerostris darwini TaxID=1538125 RepID=A0AAV4Q2W5_9ARAC|nr:uncharacterized protein CDAR_253851 [Caerostris darwini]